MKRRCKGDVWSTRAEGWGKKGEEEEEEVEQAADSSVLMRHVPRPASETLTARGRRTKAGVGILRLHRLLLRWGMNSADEICKSR